MMGREVVSGIERSRGVSISLDSEREMADMKAWGYALETPFWWDLFGL